MKFNQISTDRMDYDNDLWYIFINFPLKFDGAFKTGPGGLPIKNAKKFNLIADNLLNPFSLSFYFWLFNIFLITRQKSN